MKGTHRERDLINRLKALAQEVCAREGVLLYDLEVVTGSRGRGRALRVYIDRRSLANETLPIDSKELSENIEEAGPGESGISSASVGDCANVSRGLSLLLDVEDLMGEGHYDLEVSTPGLERVLREKWHFEAVVGSLIEVKTYESLDRLDPHYSSWGTRSRFVGKLVKVEGDSVVLRMDDINTRRSDNVAESKDSSKLKSEISFPLNWISRARKIVPFETKAGAPQREKKHHDRKNMERRKE